MPPVVADVPRGDKVDRTPRRSTFLALDSVTASRVPSAADRPRGVREVVASGVDLVPNVGVTEVRVATTTVPTAEPDIPVVASLYSTFTFLHFTG